MIKELVKGAKEAPRPKAYDLPTVEGLSPAVKQALGQLAP